VGPDVVRVTVAAEGVVGRHDVGPVASDEPDEAPGGLVEVRLPEAARIEVRRPAHHVRVPVVEVLPLGDAELGQGVLELAHPDLAEPAAVRRGVELGEDDLAELAPGAGHEDDPVAVGDGLRHDPAGADGLVVGVGVDGHEGERSRCHSSDRTPFGRDARP